MIKPIKQHRFLCGISAIALVAALPTSAQNLGDDGFVFVVDGQQINGPSDFDEKKYSTVDPQRTEPKAPTIDNGEIYIRNDGFAAEPALDFKIVENGGAMQVSTYANYPAFIQRGEVVAYQMQNGRVRAVAAVPIAPNQQANVSLPRGNDVIYAYRVYNDQGRFDQTHVKALNQDNYDMTVGANTLDRQVIPVFGESVRINADHAMPGGKIRTMGEEFTVPSTGEMVVERIIPPGTHNIKATYQSPYAEREAEQYLIVPKSDWFYTGIIDLTYGQYLTDSRDHQAGDDFNNGHVAFFARGRTDGDYQITAAADTGEGEIEEIFKGFDKKDPNSILNRVDQEDFFPVYGDQSVSEDFAPTSGKLFLRVDHGDDWAQWGDFKAGIDGADYVRSDRMLYGARGHVTLDATHQNGEPIAQLDAYAASPDRLAQRDVFLGTGGSVYFLKEQDLTHASQNLFVEYRDPETGRVINRRQLTQGTDYDINYTQGVITLRSPLSSKGPVDGFGNGTEARLVAEYEYTPSIVNPDDISTGARAEISPIEGVKVGVTALREEQGINTQTLEGADVSVRIGQNSEIRGEIARSEGPGFGYATSEDGGLTLNDVASNARLGEAYARKVEARIDLQDINPQTRGLIEAYYEERDAGFSSLDYNVAFDEIIYGASIETEFARVGVKAFGEHYENETGVLREKAGVEASIKVTDSTKLIAGLSQEREEDLLSKGELTQGLLRIEQQVNQELMVYIYGREAIEAKGTMTADNRYGLGARYDVNRYWKVTGEVSTGTEGNGAELLAQYDRGDGNQSYFGYSLDPYRDMGDNTLTGTDYGQLVIGSRNQINPSLSTFAEARYDMFGEHRSLGQAYGIRYRLNDEWDFSGAAELAQINDSVNGDYNRTAISLGANYAQKDVFVMDSRVEYRRDEGVQNGSDIDRRSILGLFKGRYTPNPEHSYFLNAKAMTVWNSPLADTNGDYIDVQAGYAYRPIDNDRWNALVQYRYIHDELDHVLNGAVSSDYDGMHIAAVDARYDIDGHWDVGGRVAFRDAFTIAGNGTQTHNRAVMFAPSVRYKISHEWDVSASYRMMQHLDSDLIDTSATMAVYRHLTDNLQLGIGYNWGSFTDDLTDMDDETNAVFFNLVADF